MKDTINAKNPLIKQKKSKTPVIIAVSVVGVLLLVIVGVLSSSRSGDSYVGSWKSVGTASNITFEIKSDNTMVAHVNGHTYSGKWSEVDENNILGICDGSYFAVQYSKSSDAIKVVVTSQRGSSDPLITVNCQRKGIF